MNLFQKNDRFGGRRLGVFAGMLTFTMFFAAGCGAEMPVASISTEDPSAAERSFARAPGLRQAFLRAARSEALNARTQQKISTLAMTRGGYSVALSRDGNTALIGAPWADERNIHFNGAAFVFVRTGAGWVEQQMLVASDGASQQFFGGSVALSADGNTALIGFSWEPTFGPDHVGAAYVFVRTGKRWVEQQKLLASDMESRDSFGISVALSADGNTALIGAIRKSDSGTRENGAAYVFARREARFTEQQKLLASDKESHEHFGASVALSADGNTALIGAAGESGSGIGGNGAAYLFLRSGTKFTEPQKLLASDKDNDDSFGISVALSADGNTALIGAAGESDGDKFSNGAAYVFARAGTRFTEQQKLLARDKDTFELFGGSVALSGDGNTALIGAYKEHGGGSFQHGAAYVFGRAGTRFSQKEKLLASDKREFDWFGYSVALSSNGSTALIGAPGTNETDIILPGAAYVLEQGIGN